MANTEGLPDEFVESLMSTTSTTSRMSARQRMLQQRMEMPMSEGRPAAKVVRASPGTSSGSSTRTSSTTTAPADVQSKGSTSNSASATTKATTIPPPVVGEIMERPVMSRKNTANKTGTTSRFGKGKVSRFAAQQQHQQLSSTNAAVNGFPSVHVPLGTFVNKKKKTTTTAASTITSGTPPPVIQKKTNKKSTTTTTASNKLPDANNNNNIFQASAKDAQGMLSQMSLQEIRHHQQELESALSPEMMAFLKRRGQSKKQQQPHQKPKKVSLAPPQLEQPNPTGVPKPATTTKPVATKEDERLEKERLAKLMASVRTHQDLDSAYHAEMQQAHPLENNDDQDVPTTSNNDDLNKNFTLACDLLRSTSPRQALWAARVVCKALEEQANQTKASTDDDNGDKVSLTIPVALPVSLRCLLDSALSAGGVLHTYVLQSLYQLLLLFANPNHKLVVSSSSLPLDADLYQQYTMEDAIPTPSLDTAYPGASTPQPLSMDKNNGKTPPGAYSTSSSATSAQADGQAFQKDPMWTLLSKMQIIPRLAQLLVNQEEEEELPPEAWSAACGILGMLSQRSPGAASAIVHHKSLLQSILNRTIYRLQHHLNNVPTQETTYAALKLLCVIVRQSRATALQIVSLTQDILPCLLSLQASSRLELQLQQLALLLWRTLLRYGLGLEAFSTILSLAARHWTLPYTQEYSLSADYLAALTQVLELAKVARAKRAPTIGSTGPLQTKHVEILSMASTYLSATKQSVLLQASTPPTARDNHSDVDETIIVTLNYRWNAARLRFLTAYWSLSSDQQPPSPNGTTNEEIKAEEMLMEDRMACLMVLGQWIAPGGFVSTACKSIMSSITNNGDTGPANSKQVESAACSLVGSVASFLSMIEQQYASLDENDGSAMMVKGQCKSIVTRFLERLASLGAYKALMMADYSSKTTSELARLGWINQCQFAISKLYFQTVSADTLTTTASSTAVETKNMARAFAFATLGRLQRGDESMAAVLFSQDVLFRSHSHDSNNTANGVAQNDDDKENASSTSDSSSSSSPISTMFLGELCGSDSARTQLDHSFKRNHGLGITAGGFGPFSLDSLLSNADQPPSAATTTKSELILPMGPLWLWQSLSGFIRMKNEAVESGVQEAATVVSAVLGLILELEAPPNEDSVDHASNTTTATTSYAGNIPAGAKLYYLMNVCLHSEAILREDRVMKAAEAVFDRYWPQLTRSAVHEFKTECLKHTNPSKQGKQQTNGEDGNEEEEDEELDEKDKKLFDLLTQTTSNASPNEWSREDLQSTEAFLEDLATAYNDYGAQYPFFTKCMRVFFSPYFPSSIRLRALSELRGMWHSLTLDSELQDRTELAVVLAPTVMDGTIPVTLTTQSDSTETTNKDSADVVDAISSILAQSADSRPLDGFMLAFSVSLVARDIIIGSTNAIDPYQMQFNSVWKRRLGEFGAKTESLVNETLAGFKSRGEATKQALIESVLDAVDASARD